MAPLPPAGITSHVPTWALIGPQATAEEDTPQLCLLQALSRHIGRQIRQRQTPNAPAAFNAMIGRWPQHCSVVQCWLLHQFSISQSPHQPLYQPPQKDV
jgi:hypothetical protein